MQANTELIQVCGQMLICGICNKKIKQPKYLPCHHSFCFECIVDTLQLNQQKITCSVCQATHTLSFEQMQVLANDTMKSNLIIPYMNEKLKVQRTKCDVCDDDEEPGVSACVDCEIFLCELHQKAHFKAKETKTHQIIIHASNPFVGNNHHNTGMKGQPRHNSYTSGSSPNNGRLLLIEASPNDGSTPPHKRKLEDTSDDEKTPKKRGRKAGAHDQKWDQNFDLLKNMKAQTGSFNGIRENPALHGWVQYMKVSHKRGKLAQDRVEALENIGFTWTTEKLQVRWDQRLEQLRQYKELHGHCNVPSTAKGDYSGLGQWLASTRMKKRKGHLSESKTQDLEDIGVEWSLKRTTKATVAPSADNEYYDDEDSEGNMNENGENGENDNGDNDDYDDDDDIPPNNNNNNNSNNNNFPNNNNPSNNNSPTNTPSNFSTSNYVNNNNLNNNNHNYTNYTHPNDRDATPSFPTQQLNNNNNNFNPSPSSSSLPPLSKTYSMTGNPNMTPATQSNNAKILDFLSGQLADVTARKSTQ